MKIYTKTGDDGTTGLYGGTRRSKSSIRVDTYGTVDELNSLIGTIRSFNRKARLDQILQGIQNDLFILGADLATLFENEPLKVVRTEPAMTVELEKIIDQLDAEIPPLKNFILPGGTPVASLLHLARAVCRRTERLVVRLSHEEKVNPEVLRYLNRLADLLFVLARWSNQNSGKHDVIWNVRKS